MDLFKRTHREQVILVLSALAVLVFISFLPCLKNGFVNWDDNVYFIDNPMVKHLSWDSVRSIFLSYDRTQYSPVIFLAFAVQHHFFRMEPFYYHAVSLILHLLNTCFVFWLFFLVRKNIAIAAGTALLFGIHPLRVESVAWMTEQKDLLYTLFFLLGFISFIYYRNFSRKSLYFASLFLYVVSLTVKPMVIMFPLLLVAWEMIYTRPWRKEVLWDKLPFFVLALIIIGVNWLAFIWERLTSNIGLYPVEAFYRISFYIRKIFWPSNLSCLYPNAHYTIFQSEVTWAPILLGAVLLLGFFGIKERRSFFFGTFFFILILFPVLLPHGYFIVADRYVYLAGAGIFFCVIEALRDFYETRCVAQKKRRILFFFVLCGGVFLMAHQTWRQSQVWHDGVTLWTHAVQLYPEDERIHTNLGAAYMEKREYSKALRESLHCLRLDPSARSALQLGVVYFKLKDYVKAEKCFRAVLRLSPDNAEAYNALGLIYALRPDEFSQREAIKLFKNAIQAVAAFENSAALIRAYQNLGQTYLSLGENREALLSAREAARLNPDSVPIQTLFLQALVMNKQYGEALNVAERLMTTTPDDPWCYRMAAWLVEGAGLSEEAKVLIQKADLLDGSK